VLASSMVVYGEGRYACPEHGIVRPGARDVADLSRGRFEPPCPVCGRALEPRSVPEDAPLDPRNVYAATKLQQEHLAAAFSRETGSPVTALRYHNVYGPRMPRDTPYAGVASIFRSALEAGRAPEGVRGRRADPQLRPRPRRRPRERPRPDRGRAGARGVQRRQRHAADGRRPRGRARARRGRGGAGAGGHGRVPARRRAPRLRRRHARRARARVPRADRLRRRASPSSRRRRCVSAAGAAASWCRRPRSRRRAGA
jgi:hypothetical protein